MSTPSRTLDEVTMKPCAISNISKIVAIAGAVLGFSQQPSLAQEATPPVVFPREQWLASFDRMPETALATAFLRCDREARVHMLSFEDGVRCAMAWDALLRRLFAGDVDALIAWWLVHRDESAVD